MKCFLCFIFGFWACMMVVYAPMKKEKDKQIDAIEVYRGNTTLEYKVIEGIKVDSTVVWKK